MVMQESAEQSPPLQSSREDIAHTATKAVIAAIPFVGGSAAEIFAAIVTPPINRRRDEWINRISQDLEVLGAQIDRFNIESLRDDETFITTLLQATQTAARNHRKEKLEALRNAVLNTAIGRAPEEDLQILFLSFLDVFTEWHIRILMFLREPNKDFPERQRKSQIKTIKPMLRDAFPELEGKLYFMNQIVVDLQLRGLLSSDATKAPNRHKQRSIWKDWTTALGKDFLGFIMAPSEIAEQDAGHQTPTCPEST